MLGDVYKEAVLEMNASDDRGIEVVRNKIKMFAQKKVTLPPGTHKIVILDEADSMTPAAQQALRRTIEIYSNSTRFVLACNMSTKIIEPIQSRCAILRFSKLSDQEILNRVVEICKLENLKYTPEGLQALLFSSEGDLRCAVNNLQATASGYEVISEENVIKVCDIPQPQRIQGLISECVNHNIQQACKEIDSLIMQGYSSIDIITTLFKLIKGMEIDENLKLKYIQEIGQFHLRIINGLDSSLQLYGLCSKLCMIQ